MDNETILTDIDFYINAQNISKCNDMKYIHQLILKQFPNIKLWYFNGKDSNNKTVSNPTIGYGLLELVYTKGNTRDFFKVGMSANTSGISIHIMGVSDKTYLSNNFSTRIGKAAISGYCIKFKSLNNLHLNVLDELLQFGLGDRNI